MYTEMTDEYSFARPYLAPGETILWRGKPQSGHLFSGQDVFLIPFSLLWCGFAIFWFVTALQHTPLPFALFGVPFVCVGLYITVGRFFHTSHLRKNTFYVITDQKIIRKRGKKIDMLDGNRMPSVHITARDDGTGTIRFGQLMYYNHSRWNNYTMGPSDGIFALENIPDVARVQQIVHSIAREY